MSALPASLGRVLRYETYLHITNISTKRTKFHFDNFHCYSTSIAMSNSFIQSAVAQGGTSKTFEAVQHSRESTRGQ
jgi:hypothetical protein